MCRRECYTSGVTGEPTTIPSEAESRPNVARMYDYYLGGCHNFAADRAAARRGWG